MDLEVNDHTTVTSRALGRLYTRLGPRYEERYFARLQPGRAQCECGDCTNRGHVVHKGGSIACVVREGLREETGESAKGARATREVKPVATRTSGLA